MPNPLNVPITPPRVAFIDPRTGTVSREWYMFFLSLFQLSGGSTVSLDDVQKGPPMLTVDEINVIVDKASENLRPSTESTVEQIAELRKQIEALESQVRPELGTMSQIQQANVPWQTFDTTAEGVPPDIGTVAWDGGTTLGIQMTANVLLRVGEAEYVYVKASSAITKGQLCYHTGSVGSSGVITAAPTPLALADPNQIVGVAAETIANNAFGLIQISGDLRGFNTTGSSVGETWADGDALYYNPAYVGSMTKVKPSAPNQKTYIGEVINAATAGSGSMHIRIVPGSVLGGTDSNVQITTVANNDLLVYDSTDVRWENKDVTNTFNLPALSANGVLYLNASKVATAGSSLTFNGTTFAANAIGSFNSLLVGTATSLGTSQLTVENADRGIGVRITGSSKQSIFGVYIAKPDNDSTTSQRFIGFSIDNDNIGSGQINANGAGAAAFGTFSDERLKKNIVDLAPQLEKVLSLRPVEFDYKDGSGHQTGFVAQEMQHVYPDAVGDQDGFLTITGYGKTEARLIKAIQEQQAMIDDLRARIAALEAPT